MKISSLIRVQLDVAYTLFQRGWEMGIPELMHRGEDKMIKALLELWIVPQYENLSRRREEFIEKVQRLHG